MHKDYEHWHKVKTEINNSHNPPTFKTREVWWCAVGSNVGDEMDGKSEFYTRPVLVVRKFNKNIFFGVPLTTQIKENPYYYKINFKDKTQCVMLSQFRLLDSKRLRSKLGKLSPEQFSSVREEIKKII